VERREKELAAALGQLVFVRIESCSHGA
jgi:hypothetical protein